MAHLESAERLRSPEYWDGVDINNLDASERSEPDTEILSLDKLQYAGGMLLNAVRDIARGEYTEVTVPLAPNDGAPLKQYPEGTVIVMDREYLLRQNNYSNHSFIYPAWMPEEDPSYPTSAGPIREPFITHWLNAQEASDWQRFGTDTAYFANGRQMYARALLWGVLVKGDDHMLVPTYGFDFNRGGLTGRCPRIVGDKVSLFLTEGRRPEPDLFTTFTESVALTRSRPYVRFVDQVYPIETRSLEWVDRGRPEKGRFYVEMAERTRGVQVIQTAGDSTAPVLRKEQKGFLQFLDLAR